jgi:hypothetical protein
MLVQNFFPERTRQLTSDNVLHSHGKESESQPAIVSTYHVDMRTTVVQAE